jgi:hypothetical protein
MAASAAVASLLVAASHAAQVPPPLGRKCAFSVPQQDVIFDLGPLAKQRDVKFTSGNDMQDMLAGTPLAEIFGGNEPKQTITISVCGDTRGDGDAMCRGEHAPGVVLTQWLKPWLKPWNSQVGVELVPRSCRRVCSSWSATHLARPR